MQRQPNGQTKLDPSWDDVPQNVHIYKNSTFYKNCVRNRKQSCIICADCPFRGLIEQYERSNKIENRRT